MQTSLRLCLVSAKTVQTSLRLCLVSAKTVQTSLRLCLVSAKTVQTSLRLCLVSAKTVQTSWRLCLVSAKTVQTSLRLCLVSAKTVQTSLRLCLVSAKTVQTKFDASTLHADHSLAAETQMVDDGSGKVEVSVMIVVVMLGTIAVIAVKQVWSKAISSNYFLFYIEESVQPLNVLQKHMCKGKQTNQSLVNVSNPMGSWEFGIFFSNEGRERERERERIWWIAGRCAAILKYMLAERR